jgi:hypothetical protein
LNPVKSLSNPVKSLSNLDPCSASLMGDYMFFRQETSTIQICEDISVLRSIAPEHMEDDNNVDNACVSDIDPMPLTKNNV